MDELFAAIDRELAIANEHGTGALSDELPVELPPVQAAESTDATVTEEWDGPVEDSMMPSPDEPSAVPAHLATSFAAAALAAAALFWLLLGPLYGYLLARFAEARAPATRKVPA